MSPEEFLDLVKKEREYQEGRKLTDLDSKNTCNDWVSYIAKYAGRGGTSNPGVMPVDNPEFKAAMVKVATLAFSALGGKLS